jgi:pimeloyl-ACP methyl ester carboxylesterase
VLTGALKRRVMVALAITVALFLIGAVYQTLSARRESIRFPPPGQLIPVETKGSKRRLHLVCLGQGEPTVIFESGGFTNSLSFGAARQELSHSTRVCSYDRMGMGWSDPAPGVISVGMLADDLQSLVSQAGLQPPFIVVPSSLGGLTAEMFARRYPEKIAGLVFIDAANSAMIDALVATLSPAQVSLTCLAEPAARFGVLRLLDPFGLRKEQSEEAARSISRLYRVEPMQTLCGLARGLPATQWEFKMAPKLASDVPLRVLIHERPFGFLPARLAESKALSDRIASFDSEWIGLQQRFARSSSRGTWSVVPGSNHLIASDQPHAVAASVLEVVAKIRASAEE